MGADMILSTLWRKREEANNIDVGTVVKKMLEVLKKEEDKDTFVRAFAYATGKDFDDIEPLVAEVMWECKKQNSDEIQETYNTMLNFYRDIIGKLERSLVCREVAEIWTPGLIGYTTGGLSWGEDTDTGQFWNTLLFDTDPEYARHPYADELYNAIFVDPSQFYKDQTKALSEELEETKAKISKVKLIIEDESWGEKDTIELQDALKQAIQ